MRPAMTPTLDPALVADVISYVLGENKKTFLIDDLRKQRDALRAMASTPAPTLIEGDMREFEDGLWWTFKNGRWEIPVVVQTEAPAPKCGCGLATCVEPWEPGCGLGTSAEHAVVADDGLTAAYMAGRHDARTKPAQEAGAVSDAAVEDVLCEALAWGATYGPVIPGHQWDEMRDKMVKQYAAKLPPAAKPASVSLSRQQHAHAPPYPDAATDPFNALMTKPAPGVDDAVVLALLEEAWGHIPPGLLSDQIHCALMRRKPSVANLGEAAANVSESTAHAAGRAEP